MEFQPLPVAQVRQWLMAKSATDAARDLTGAATLVKIYGRLDGWKPEERGFARSVRRGCMMPS